MAAGVSYTCLSNPAQGACVSRSSPSDDEAKECVHRTYQRREPEKDETAAGPVCVNTKNKQQMRMSFTLCVHHSTSILSCFDKPLSARSWLH